MDERQMKIFDASIQLACAIVPNETDKQTIADLSHGLAVILYDVIDADE